MYSILCVVDDPNRLDDVLDAWHVAGVGGVTILESTGIHRKRHMPELPMRYAFGEAASERGNYTLLAVVETEALVRACLTATEQILGDLNGPNTGVFTAWPLMLAKGMSRKNGEKGAP
jgi:hypothetical protein